MAELVRGVSLGPATLVALVAGFVSLLYLGAMLTFAEGLSAPLDDTYIYFQYARRAAAGHPFQYSTGAEFTSGATSLGYPFLLAAGHLVGFRGDGLTAFAYILASAGLVTTCLLVYATVRRFLGMGAGLATGLLVAVNGWMAWGYLSMMEIWLYGTALMVVVFTLSSLSSGRAKLAWPVGMVAAATLVFLRPEAFVAAATASALGLLVWTFAHRREEKTQQAQPIDLRWGLLPFVALGAYLLVNWIGSGSISTTGFAAKSVLTDPALSGLEKIAEIANNFATGSAEIFGHFGPQPVGALALGLGLIGATTGVARDLRTARLGPVSVSAALLVAGLLGASQGIGLGFIHARYIIGLLPLAAILTIAGVWELGTLLRTDEAVKAAGGAGLVALTMLALPGWAAQYGENAGEIMAQQKEVGMWLRNNTPEGATIAINDAGAIAYYSDRPVFDVVGLVTKRQARWFREGIGTRYESIERLAAEERPDYFAVYPNWVRFVTQVPEFTPLYAFRLEDRQIVGGATVVIYEAHYESLERSERPSELGERRVVDQVDIADLDSEANHKYETLTRQPGARNPQVVEQRSLGADGPPAIDGGRAVSKRERFVLRAQPGTDVVLRGRLLTPRQQPSAGMPVPDAGYTMTVSVNGGHVGVFRSLPAESSEEEAGSWEEQEVLIPAALNQTGSLVVEISVDTPWVYESYHYWVLQ